jgi:adenine-specific DNA-methyltransferase
MVLPLAPPPDALVEAIDLSRVRLSRELDATRRDELGQFLTPAPVARALAAMFTPLTGKVRLLDPGAGIGMLGAALVASLLAQEVPPTTITLTAYEVDEAMHRGLDQTLTDIADVCARAGVAFTGELRGEDFLAAGVAGLDGDLFAAEEAEPYDAAILNPPYRKINTGSQERELARRIGLETSNIYTAFLAVAAGVLRDGGQMVAIVPRSFANGTYFRPFREWFNASMVFDRMHVYEARNRAFSDDAVLQENVIFHAIKTTHRPAEVTITSSDDPSDLDPLYRKVSYDELVRPDDPTAVIHIVPDETNQRIAQRIASLPATLTDLNLTVSTGRVVDFRATKYLRPQPDDTTVPLIYPGHLRAGRIAWPAQRGKKPNALVRAPGSLDLLVPEGLYVLTKRFSSKEERRRIVAAIYDPADVVSGEVGFENHLNYFHDRGQGLDRPLALGLRAYLNSTLVDVYFRQFSGHTQVNAGDLRRLRYPSLDQLRILGDRIGETLLDQQQLDRIINEELFAVTDDGQTDPVRVRERIAEATSILRALGFPRGQLNDRSALTLLALVDLGPEDPWSASSNPMRGIAPMLDYFRDNYGKTYASGSRESVRRRTVHQFLDAGLIVINPDDPARPTNSDKTVYQVEASALELLRAYGTDEWAINLDTYLESRETLREKYAAERAMARIPITLPDGTEFTLSGGGQNILVKEVIDEFCPRWTPGGVVLYVGDTDDKFAHYDDAALRGLGVQIEQHGKMPDLIVHDVRRNWLVLIEAVTSHGPVDPKRKSELETLFRHSTAPLVLVTTFLNRAAMIGDLPKIAWETEVWCASDPTHLIHFNGERYLGPYNT